MLFMVYVLFDELRVVSNVNQAVSEILISVIMRSCNHQLARLAASRIHILD